MDIINGYIYKKNLDLNLLKLKTGCDQMYDLIKKNFSGNKNDYTGQSTLTTKLFKSYNLLMYPLPEFHELFNEIKKMFFEIIEKDITIPKKKYYIQCWLNYYRKGDFIGWHNHWPPETKSWHGYYCVDTECSFTSYIIPNNEDKIIDIISEDNLLVMSKSDGDRHRSSEWLNNDRPRITIAFDIVPREYICYDNLLNHWVPV